MDAIEPNCEVGLKNKPRSNAILSVGAEVVIVGKQWGREESSRWSERAQLPNEVSLVALSVKETLLSSPLKREQP